MLGRKYHIYVPIHGMLCECLGGNITYTCQYMACCANAWEEISHTRANTWHAVQIHGRKYHIYMPIHGMLCECLGGNVTYACQYMACCANAWEEISHTRANTWHALLKHGGVPSHVHRVGQNHIYTVCILFFWQGNHRIYGHIQCTYTILANPTYTCQYMACVAKAWWCTITRTCQSVLCTYGVIQKWHRK